MEIETKRLLLRPFEPSDAPAVARSLNNLAVARNLARVKFPNAVEDALTWFHFLNSSDPRSVVCAVAFRAAPDELIGVISYEYLEDAEADFGDWLRECCWHMGLMSEAAKALVRYAFTERKVQTLVSAFHNDNPNSGRILRRVGFVKTQQTMSFSLARNTEVPVTKMQLTKSRWNSTRNIQS